MANHKSSKKRIRQTVTKRAHNRLYHKTARNAVKALRNTSESIQQISERLGFGSVSYFSAQFRKAVGQTPSDYRNRRGGAAAPPETLQSGS